MNAPIQIAGIVCGNPLMNAAYIGSKTLKDVRTLAKARSGAVVVGSISVLPRKQNPGQVYWAHKSGYALNSYGLPNGGLPYFTTQLPKMVAVAHDQTKPLIANIVAFSAEDFAKLVLFAQQCGVDMVELNLSCPNVWDDGPQKRIVSYHPALVHDVLAAVKKKRPHVPISVKISPLPPDTLRDITKVIVRSGIVSAITATNTYPNASPGAGSALAGLSGPALKPISLGVVKQLANHLPSCIDIIGVGGICNASDARDYLAAGAKAVQIATGLVNSGPVLFEKILSEASSVSH